MTDCYRAGLDLSTARSTYDMTIWNDVPAAQIDERLDDLARFMSAVARDRLKVWGVQP